MRVQLRIFVPALVMVVALVCVSCEWTGTKPGGNTNVNRPTGPGIINATLLVHVGGPSPIRCTAPSIAWTANSTAGSTQNQTSPAITESDNVLSKCDEYTPLEGTKVTWCGCPVSVSFTGLAAGTWNIQAGSVASCDVPVNAGQTVVATLYTHGRPCTKFP